MNTSFKISRASFASIGVGIALVLSLSACPPVAPVVKELQNIIEDTTLTAGTYVARQSISVRNGAKLTILPGVTIIFEQGYSMSVEGPAKLYAVGTEANPIVLAGDEMMRGFWGGLRFNNTNSTENRLEYVIVEYGGGYYNANLYLTGTSSNPTRAVINHCTFRQSETYGLATAGSVTIGDFTDNVLTSNTLGAASLDANHVGFLEDTSTFTGNDVDIVDVRAGNVTADTAWSGIDAPYAIDTGVSVLAALDIEPGAVLAFAAGHAMSVEPGGRLAAIGTAEEPILFTGAEATRGYWGGLRFNNTNSTENRVEYVIFEYGGGYYNANVYLTGSSTNPTRVAINHCVFRHSSKFGLLTNGLVTIDGFADNTLTQNAQGAASINADHLGFLEDSSTFVGNDVDLSLIHI